MVKYLIVIVTLLALAGCSSVLSDRVLEAQPSVSFATVRENPDQSTGKLVVVGGRLLGIHQVDGISYLEVLEHPLDSRLRPADADVSAGRFLIQMAGQPDPQVWSRDRLVTLAGKVVGVQSRALGQTSYTYPILNLEEVHLWPIEDYYYSRPLSTFSIGGGLSF
ncbi:MAG: hypothetical protein G3M70_14915 [Candidatus Nitronauta litoralis]|uniref:Outer membrane lipoprotein Slp n=1 Tax=Candidatus Nitronauta litoralis TaxID=2705533 RepID=A0A7T0G112_9BACT|nr:MAG: hypothetical protein G3M70_14915 [Candidatus Nitronauta litoralis]